MPPLVYYIPVSLGTVSDHSPMSQIVHTRSAINLKDTSRMNRSEKGEYWLSLSLGELQEIRSRSNRDGLDGFKSYVDWGKEEYDSLASRQKSIQERRKSLKFWNVNELILLIRDVRAFEKDCRALLKDTRMTSEKMDRKLLSSEDLSVQAEQLGSALPAEQSISGIALRLDSALDPETAALLQNVDNIVLEGNSTTSGLHTVPEELESCLSGPSTGSTGGETINHSGDRITVINVINSAVNPTFNTGGQNHRGAIAAPRD